jgi:hypothetical protein
MERVYAAMILALDRGIGTIINALKETDQYDNTVIIFTSDNGGANYAHLPHVNYPYRGWKATLFEGGVHVPLFMQWPKMIKANKGRTTDDDDDDDDDDSSSSIINSSNYQHHHDFLSKQPVSHIDLFPTILSMVNCSNHDIISSGLDGIDLWPMISSSSSSSSSVHSSFSLSSLSSNDMSVTIPPNRERILFWRSGDDIAIRQGDFKLQISSNHHRNKVWFYDLKHDPYEQLNLADVFFGIHTVEDLHRYATAAVIKNDGCTNDGSTDDDDAVTDDDDGSTDDDDDNGGGGRHIVDDGMNINSSIYDMIKNQIIDKESIRRRMLEVYNILLLTDSQQKDPQWPALYQVPILIDKIEGSIININDEYIYWDN